MKVVNYTMPAYPRICGASQRTYFMAALTQDEEGLYAVYAAMVGADDLEDDGALRVKAETVGHLDVKLTYKKALAYFPSLKQENYRR